MGIKVVRQQWPVGQGCFASGSISAADKSFVYVYDCGSETQSAIRQSIQSLHPKDDLIDALFISHLDSDHVSGIDYLCSSCGYKVDTVYLPYLSMIDCLIVIGASLADDSFSWTLAEAVIEPRKWFRQRGVSKVVMIRRRDIDDEEGPVLPEEFVLDIPPDAKVAIKHTLEANHRLGAFELPKFAKTYPPREKQVALSVASSRTVFFLSSLVDAPTWILVPFVPPLPKYAIDSFIKKVKEDLGLRISYKSIRSRKDVSHLVAVLQDRATRHKLKATYKTLAQDHNSVSMCLYSGPWSLRNDKVYWNVMRPPSDYMHYNRVHAVQKYGWIGTGDLPLNLDHHLDAFKQHYGRFADNISTLLLPHHGSHYSFSPALGHFCSPEISLTSAGSKNRYGHPHPGVVAAMRLFGSQVCQVTEKPLSSIIEEIYIER